MRYLFCHVNNIFLVSQPYLHSNYKEIPPIYWMTLVERNGASCRTCLKCRQYKYIGSIPGIVYRFFSEKIYFLHQNILYTLNYYFMHVHSSDYRIAVLHRHVVLAFLTGGTMNL